MRGTQGEIMRLKKSSRNSAFCLCIVPAQRIKANDGPNEAKWSKEKGSVAWSEGAAQFLPPSTFFQGKHFMITFTLLCYFKKQPVLLTSSVFPEECPSFISRNLHLAIFHLHSSPAPFLCSEWNSR